MKYYRFISETPYCGTEQEFYHSFEYEPTQDDLESMADDYAYEAYESYLYLHTGWDDENLEGMSEEEKEEFCEDFRADCLCTYEEITEEEFEENILRGLTNSPIHDIIKPSKEQSKEEKRWLDLRQTESNQLGIGKMIILLHPKRRLLYPFYNI